METGWSLGKGMSTPVLVIDLEATCWEQRSPEQRNEIIEIGCAIVRDNEITFNESWFVRPSLNPQLSDFCRELTTIKQSDVDSAPLFPEALRNFTLQMEQVTGLKIVQLPFVSWGDYDRKQLHSDCALHGIDYPFGEHFNLKQFFRDKYKTKRAGVKDALRTLSLEFQGTHHRGKSDAFNIARIFLTLGKPL